MSELRWRSTGEGQEERMTEYRNSDLIAVVDEYVHSERDRKILKRRYIDGICFEDLGEEFQMSVRQIQNIVYKHQDRIFKHIGKV